MSFDMIALKAKLMLTGSVEKSERFAIRKCAELTRNDELFLTVLNDQRIEYYIQAECAASFVESVKKIYQMVICNT